jgi:hypothetical protein
LCQQKVTGAQTMLLLKLKNCMAHQTIPQKLKSLSPQAAPAIEYGKFNGQNLMGTDDITNRRFYK